MSYFQDLLKSNKAKFSTHQTDLTVLGRCASVL